MATPYFTVVSHNPILPIILNIAAQTASNLKVTTPENQYFAKKSLCQEKLAQFAFPHALFENHGSHLKELKIKKMHNNKKKIYKRPKLSTLEYNNSPKYHWIPSTNTETTARYVESVKNLALSILGLWLAGSALLAQSAEKTFIGHSHKCKEAPETIKQHGYVETHIPNSSKLSTSFT